MPQLPFDIPKSLSSYAEHFETDPIKATTRLKKQLKKRGADAVGHFLLAWFYHLKNMDDEAVDYALKAKIYAPGSPFFEKLHYYLSHPRNFEAWTPGYSSRSTPTKISQSSVAQPGPVLDLDALVEKLSEIESHRIRPSESDFAVNTEHVEHSGDVDDIVSETLASIHERQGKTDAAIRTYKRLKELNAEKREFYKQQIERLKRQREQNNEGNS